MNIESGIPIPPPNTRESVFAQTIRGMKVGQSVHVESASKRDHARKIIKSLGGTYVSRKMDKGFRVWRTA